MRPMTEKFIPEHIDPFRFAEQGLSLDGAIKLAEMPRLGSLLGSPEGQVHVDLHFGRDEQGITSLVGRLETTLILECQRCMEPFNYGIISDFALGIVNTLDEANALPERYEAALAKDGSLALRELIEDEIILNLPIIPKHEPEDCKVKLPLAGQGQEQEKEQGKGENPFRVLESLKHKQS